MSKTRPLFTLLLITAIATAAVAEHPNVAKGFQADKVYQFSGVDNVNLYNGNVNLSIPIGSTYGGNGTLRYGLTLSYNSKAWDQNIETYQEGCPQNNADWCQQQYIKAVPSRRSNAGMGWLLSLGRLICPDDPMVSPGVSGITYWSYESPDGADHNFVMNDSTDGSVAYTKDGSFLRLKGRSDGHREVHFPDGMVHVFAPTSDSCSPRLHEIIDPFGNRLRVEYTTSGWAFREYRADNYGLLAQPVREHFVRTRPVTEYLPTDAPQNYATVVDEVDLAGFGGTRSIYRFAYTNDVIAYAFYGEWRGPETPDPKVSRLRTITLPDGVSTWEFDYYSFDGSAIKSLVYPTKGRVEWTYKRWVMPTSGCQIRAEIIDLRPADPPFSVVEGLLSKKIILPDSTATWSYTQGLTSPIWMNYCEGSGDRAQQSTVTVTPPDGRSVTEHYFSVWPFAFGDGGSAFDKSEYGLPFTRLADGQPCSRTNPNALCLSSRTFEVLANGQRQQKVSTYVRYEGETRELIEVVDEQYRREVATRTVFHEDGNAQIDTTRSEYDGLGHFRKTTTKGSWSADDLRVETTNYNPDKPPVVVDPATWQNIPANNRPPVSAKWLLGLFDTRTVSDKAATLKSEVWFDASTGFLNRQRTLRAADGSQSTTDLLAAYGRDALGNVTSESYYGGDHQSLSTGPLSGLVLPSQPQYKLGHSYQHGARSHSAYLSGTGAEVLRVMQATIDQSTGFVSSSVDSADVATTYQFDTSARLSAVIPTGTARMTYEYIPATSTVNAKVTERAKSNSNVTLTTKSYDYDGLGRVIREWVTNPGGGQSRREIAYDPMGRKATVSELGTAPSLPVSVFTYDALGRLGKTKAPDSSETTFGYTGSRVKTQTSSLALPGADANQIRTAEHDPFGRLVKVTEKSGPTSAASANGSDTITQYTYDPADRLVGVRMEPTGGAVVQNRTFDYDGRGFLRWESHPEAGMTSYTYDARGHVITKSQSAANSLFDLSYVYDAAERPVTILGRNPYFDPNFPNDPDYPLFRVMKTFAYGSDNLADDRRKGKLLTAARYNYHPTDDIGTTYKVAEIYKYGDTAGRRTSRRTTITRGLGANETGWDLYRQIDMAMTYDELSLPSIIEYPMCVDCGAPLTHPLRNQTYAYDQTRLTGVTGFVSGMTYSPNGMWNAVTRTNTMTDTQTVHGSGMPRPGSISSNYSNSCTSPSIATDPVGGTVSGSTPSVTLTVAVNGTGPFSYEWWSNNPSGPVGTGPSYVASPASTTAYWVVVTNGCGSVESASAIVSDQCIAPGGTATYTANLNGSYTLVANGEGTEPRTYTWRRASDQSLVGTGRKVTVTGVTATTTYTVTIANGCPGSPVTRNVTVSFEAPVPPTLVATRTGNTQITVTWSGLTGGAIQRRSGSAGWEELGNVTGTSYVDNALQAGKTYAYRLESGVFTNSDVATTATFAVVSAGDLISASSLAPMLAAVNSVRATVGWPAVTWSNILSDDDPLPVPGSTIMAVHIATCRARMNEALQALGAPVATYSNAGVKGKLIAAIQINEIMGRAY